MSWFRLVRMNGTKGRRLNAALLLGLFLFVLGLASSSQAHRAFHPNASQPDHHCAVTMLASGKVDAAPSAVAAPLAPPLLVSVVWAGISSPSVVSFNLLPSRGPPAVLS